MKTIQKDELYENLSQFLKSKGIELKEGSYTKSVHAGCSMLADAVNLSQAVLERAKTELEKRLDQVRQVIHESTAPKPPVAAKPQPKTGSKAGARNSKPKVQRRKPQARTKAGKKKAT